MELNNEQREIIKHAMRSPGELFCGGGVDMNGLVEAGYMEYAGKKSFVPDPYYRVTGAGKKAVA